MGTELTKIATPPICQKCGERARVAVIMKSHIRRPINADGSLGPIMSISGSPGDIVGFECGGGHRFLPTNRITVEDI